MPRIDGWYGLLFLYRWFFVQMKSEKLKLKKMKLIQSAFVQSIAILLQFKSDFSFFKISLQICVKVAFQNNLKQQFN